MAKVDLYPDFKDFLESLNSESIRYLLIGGYAVNFYGYRRPTDDLDVWIALERENLEKVSRVLQRFAGFPAKTVAPSVLSEPGKVFIFGREPVRIDLLTGPSGVEFDSCYQRRRVVDLDGVKVPLISFDDLRQNKRASGRNKDLADLDNLPTQWSWPETKKPARKKPRPRRRK
jgi:hypothetical protein